MEDLGFIITRHVTSDATNRYWNECCRCIRLFYPTTPIVIIDDASDPAFVKGDLQPKCTVIESDYPRRGEILPYLFLRKHRTFKKAVILHDSVFITAPLPIESVTNVKFLWHFEGDQLDNEDSVNNCIDVLPDAPKLRNMFYHERWRGCFGTQSVITLEFLDTLPIEPLVTVIRNRNDRCGFERVFGLLCGLRIPDLFASPSLFGHIMYSPRGWGYTFDQYQHHAPGAPVKVWTGR